MAQAGVAAERRPVPDRVPRWLEWTIFLLLLGGASGLLADLGRGTTFFYDEWNFVLHARRSIWSVVLLPHNGHPSMVPTLLYRALFVTVGLRAYWPYRLLAVGLLAATSVLVFVALRTRVGFVLAGVGALAVPLAGRAWEDLLWPFQMSFVLSMLGGLAALVLLERDRRSADALAALAALVGLASSGLGLAWAAAVAVDLLWSGRWRRLWVVALPSIPMALWYLRDDAHLAKLVFLRAAPAFFVHAAVGDVANLIDIPRAAARLAVVAGSLAAFAALLRGGRGVGRLAAALAGLATFWTLTLVARGPGVLDPSRYLLPDLVFLVLGLGELAVLATLVPSRARPVVSGAAALASAAAFAYGIVGSLPALQDGARSLRAISRIDEAALGAVQMTAGALPPGFRPEPHLMPQVLTGPYLAVAERLGSPALAPAAIAEVPALATVASSVFQVVLADAARPWRSPHARRWRCEQERFGAGLDLALAPGQPLGLRAGGGALALWLEPVGSIPTGVPGLVLPAHGGLLLPRGADWGPAPTDATLGRWAVRWTLWGRGVDPRAGTGLACRPSP